MGPRGHGLASDEEECSGSNFQHMAQKDLGCVGHCFPSAEREPEKDPCRPDGQQAPKLCHWDPWRCREVRAESLRCAVVHLGRQGLHNA